MAYFESNWSFYLGFGLIFSISNMWLSSYMFGIYGTLFPILVGTSVAAEPPQVAGGDVTQSQAIMKLRSDNIPARIPIFWLSMKVVRTLL